MLRYFIWVMFFFFPFQFGGMYTFDFIISIYGLLRSREIIRVGGEKSAAMANHLQDSLWTNCNLPEPLKVMQNLPCKVAQRWHSCCQRADLHINCSLPQSGRRELEKCQSWGLRAGSEQSGSRIGSGVLSQTNNEQKQEKMTIIWTIMWSVLGSVTVEYSTHGTQMGYLIIFDC